MKQKKQVDTLIPKRQTENEGLPHRPLGNTVKHRVVTYLWLISYVIRQRISYHDLPSLFLLVVSPLLHFLRFKGRLPTPLGSVNIYNDDVLREFVYAFFKTKFRYMPMLASIPVETSHRSTIVDVGANIGDFTLAVSRKAGRVISIEPGRETFATLCANLRANSLNNVIALNIGAHDSEESLNFEGDYLEFRVSKHGTEQQAPGVPLDLVLSTYGIEHVNILKIDVQGHETKVLKGAIASLKRHSVDLAIVEVHPRRGVKIDDVVFFMQSFDYRLVGRNNGPFQPQLYFMNSYDPSSKIR